MVLSSSFLAKDFYFGLVGRVDPAVAANAGLGVSMAKTITQRCG
jgi:hypothetical protein